MHLKTLKRDYISSAGTFLNELENSDKKISEARTAEEQKYQNLGNARDVADESSADSKLWKGF